MQRTYKSKKEMGGGLGPKDLLYSLDNPNSMFDALYIQNIKQTKREMSCMGSSSQFNSAANRVRKRKYVKKLVKEPVLETSKCTFLTPDKSIRVNKGQDLFDQLLNSFSPPGQSLGPRENKDKLFDQLKESIKKKDHKKYNKKQVKKFNCSSDTTDSDKENENVQSKQYLSTDFGHHKLVIEKEIKECPQDESIHRLINLSLLKKVISESPKSVNKIHRNRLTKNLKSPNANSPLCSTPYTQKYRSKSIYNLSPITLRDWGDSDETKKDITVVSSNNAFKTKTLSPVLKYPEKSDSRINSNLIKSNKSFKCNNQSLADNDNKSLLTDYNSKQNSELTPLLGFTNKSSDIFSTDDESSRKSIVLPSRSRSYKKHDVSPKDNIGDKGIGPSKREETDDNSSPESIKVAEGDIKENILKDKVVCLVDDDSVNIDINDKSDLTVVENIIKETDVDNLGSNDAGTSFSCNKDEEADLSCDSVSLYDTCSSSDEQNCIRDNKNIEKIPLVVINRMNYSNFQKYNVIDVLDSSTDLNESLENKVDNVDITNNSNESNDMNKSSEENVTVSALYNKKDTNERESQDNLKVSFVTTRRRNVVNDSILMNFDNSDDSATSSEANNTVLNKESCANNIDSKEKSNKILDKKTKLSESNKASDIGRRSVALRKSRISVKRPSTRLTQEDESINFDHSNIKQPIVLQPGKKWERSLSIYRRMSVLGDVNRSILEEDLVKKGRKYRESVINTMEMQEIKGPLHNDSFSSCRSSILAKPYRSTIRISKEPNASRLSVHSKTVIHDLTGFLHEDCDDTVVDLSKLSIDPENEVTIIEKVQNLSHRLHTARDFVLRRCNQTAPLLFDECYPDTVLKNCHKIGEGVYGEVFLWRARDGQARVMKIVPVAGAIRVNGEQQKDYQEIISEIVIAMELSTLRAPIAEIESHIDEGHDIETLDLHSIENATDCFNEVLKVRCVYGNYPNRLLDLWELYDECKGSENDNPAILPVDQAYIVLELANAGQDLESYQFNNAEQSYALFLQVAYALAVGEEAYQFEHRDLHWGNILIAPTEQKCALFVLRGRPYIVPRRGVSATIIDYSLSRVSLRGLSLFNDLSGDDGLFDALGDYQFDVYRLMRDKLRNDWEKFEPYTNVLWLHYTVDKMITALRYKRTNTKIHKHYMNKLKGIKNRILNYKSAVHFVLTDNEFLEQNYNYKLC